VSVPATDSTTPGWTLLDLWAAGDLPFATASSWFARVGNVTDKVATNAASIATVRGLSPLAGRALTVGLRTRF
jgi:iron complex outermembrane recepter protein